MNTRIIIGISFMSSSVFAVSPDSHFFSIINNTNQNFALEISYGTVAKNTASIPSTIRKPDVEIGEYYQDKQIFELDSGVGIDIKKSEINRYPMFLTLYQENISGLSGKHVFQKSDKTYRARIAVGVDNVLNRSGLVINADAAGHIGYKFYDGRPNAKVIKPTRMLMDRDRDDN